MNIAEVAFEGLQNSSCGFGAALLKSISVNRKAAKEVHAG